MNAAAVYIYDDIFAALYESVYSICHNITVRRSDCGHLLLFSANRQKGQPYAAPKPCILKVYLLASHCWLAIVQEVLQADWQDVWHLPQPPFAAVSFKLALLIVLICFISITLRKYIYSYSISHFFRNCNSLFAIYTPVSFCPVFQSGNDPRLVEIRLSAGRKKLYAVIGDIRLRKPELLKNIEYYAELAGVYTRSVRDYLRL